MLNKTQNKSGIGSEIKFQLFKFVIVAAVWSLVKADQINEWKKASGKKATDRIV